MEHTSHGEQPTITELKQQRESFRSRIFLMMLEIAVVFLVPALIAVFVGRHFDTATGGSTYTVAALGVSFVLSWVIVIFRYRAASKKLEALSRTIDEASSR